MKQRIFLILLAFALIFAFAGCSVDDPDGGLLINIVGFSGIRSHEELALAKQEADPKNDPAKLMSLDYYYVPVYAESRYNLRLIDIDEGGVASVYGYPEQKQESFLLSVKKKH